MKRGVLKLKALKAIGIERLYSEGAEFFGYGAHKKAFFWIGLKPSAITGVHVAFAVPDSAAVDRFYAVGHRSAGSTWADPRNSLTRKRPRPASDAHRVHRSPNSRAATGVGKSTISRLTAQPLR